jgi:NAD(P)-dependent dehydrogenase (short-subunit alcohol dehydrogenase family)
MASKLSGTAALVTGASSGIGAATARRLAEEGASVTLVARRQDRLQTLGAEIENSGGTALVVEADITDRTQAEAAAQQAIERSALTAMGVRSCPVSDPFGRQGLAARPSNVHSLPLGGSGIDWILGQRVADDPKALMSLPTSDRRW